MGFDLIVPGLGMLFNKISHGASKALLTAGAALPDAWSLKATVQCYTWQSLFICIVYCH